MNFTLNLTADWVTAITTAITAFGIFLFGYVEWKNIQKEKRKKKIIEFMQEIITPFIKQLEQEINFLNKKQYGWRGCKDKHYLDYIDKLEVNGDYMIIFDEFKKIFPNIIESIEQRNKIFENLKEKVIELSKVIENMNFLDKCKELISKWNVETNQNKSFTDDEIRLFISYVIDNKKELDSGYQWDIRNFWNKYGYQLLKIRESKEVKEKIDSVYKIAEELITISKNLKIELEKMRKEKMKEFALTLSEIRKEF